MLVKSVLSGHFIGTSMHSFNEGPPCNKWSSADITGSGSKGGHSADATTDIKSNKHRAMQRMASVIEKPGSAAGFRACTGMRCEYLACPVP